MSHRYTLVLAALLATTPVFAQSAVPFGTAEKGASRVASLVGTPEIGVSQRANGPLADCTAGAEVVNDIGTSAYGNGDTATSSGTAQELGQSFTAPCDGEFLDLDLAIANNFGTPSNAGASAPITITVYEGEGTDGTELFSGDFTVTLPADGMFEVFTFDIGGFDVTEDALYTFFVDATGINFTIVGNASTAPNPYADGQAVLSTSGGPEGAGTLTNPFLDLRFAARFGTPSGTSIEEAIARGGAFSPAYPNPVHGVGRVDLTVEQAQQVTVAMYDALGRRVAVVFDGPMAGLQATPIEFDASALASGTYLIRASGDTFTATQRVFVVR